MHHANQKESIPGLDKFFNTPETAKFLSVEKNTLEIWRHRGTGPKFVKFGRAVRYRLGDLQDYIEAQTRTSTRSSVYKMKR